MICQEAVSAALADMLCSDASFASPSAAVLLGTAVNPKP